MPTPPSKGVIYPSKMHGGNTSFAAYERAATALPVTPVFNRALADDRISGDAQERGQGAELSIALSAW